MHGSRLIAGSCDPAYRFKIVLFSVSVSQSVWISWVRLDCAMAGYAGVVGAFCFCCRKSISSTSPLESHLPMTGSSSAARAVRSWPYLFSASKFSSAMRQWSQIGLSVLAFSLLHTGLHSVHCPVNANYTTDLTDQALHWPNTTKSGPLFRRDSCLAALTSCS